MLRTLDIENIAVIEKASVDFSSGLNVLTGETGAGKSIVVDSINAILGERTSRELVRHGVENAFVSAYFDDICSETCDKLKENERAEARSMLEQAFQDVYTKFKLHFYQNVFQRFATREATLTTVESFCMEGIMAMGEPTIAEFSRMMQISTPNAAYKIGSLVKKGYVEKIQSTVDRREYHLRPTQKYIDYYNISYSYLSTVIERVRKRFPEEDVDKLEQMLTIISDELMPELDMPRHQDEKAES